MLSPAAERRPYLSRAFQGAVLARVPPSLIASQRDARTAAISPIHHAKSHKTPSIPERCVDIRFAASHLSASKKHRMRSIPLSPTPASRACQLTPSNTHRPSKCQRCGSKLATHSSLTKSVFQRSFTNHLFTIPPPPAQSILDCASPLALFRKLTHRRSPLASSPVNPAILLILSKKSPPHPPNPSAPKHPTP
jgi:hypothetical protein